MTQLFIEPMNVWLFRDGRPFDAGAHHRAESLFPPFASVLQGAVRSYQLARRGVPLTKPEEITRAVGTETDLKDLSLRGPIVAVQGVDGAITRYYPQPHDAVTVSLEDHSIRPADPPNPCPETLATSRSSSNIDEYILGLSDSPEKGEEGLWVAENDLLEYLNGATVTAKPSKELFSREVRPGNATDNRSKTVREGMLYEVEYIRPQPGVGLWADIKGQSYQDWPTSGLFQLGGENRASYFHQIQPSSSLPQPANPLPHRFRVYFATPALFANGWQSQDWGAFFTGAVVLRAAAVGRFLSFGGYDVKNNRQKPARRYVPAGSVYYFEAVGKDEVSFKTPFPQITDSDQALGLGQIFAGRW